MVMHGVSLSIGSSDPLDEDYLDRLSALAHRIEPAWISDHLCWTGIGGHNTHDLLPLPYTEEALAHVAERVRRVQDRLGRQILIENVSSYVTFADSAMPEWEFLAAVADAADCGILLDVNNVYVSGVNHGFDPYAYVDAVPAARVGQFHLAGHTVHETHLLDTHDHPVCDEVWALYAHAVRRFGRISTLVEWDDLIPSYGELVAESERARAAERGALAGADAVTSRAAATVRRRAPRRARPGTVRRRASVGQPERRRAPRHLPWHVLLAPARRARRGLPEAREGAR